MTTPKCSERACPYFAVPGQSLCSYHVNWFEFEESLTDSGLDYEALSAGDEEGSSGPVSQLSVTNWRDTYLEKKERREDQRFINKVALAVRYARLKENRVCPRCGLPHDRETFHCESCIKQVNENMLELRRARRAQGLCEGCGGTRDGSSTWCQKCRKRMNANTRAIRNSRIRKNLCVYCGATRDPKARLCPDCNSKWRKYYNERYRRLAAARRASGLCVICGNKKSQADKVSCVECEARHRKNARRLREERARLRPKRVPSPKNSRGNYLSNTISAKAHTQKLRAAGLCVRCKKPNDCTTWVCTQCKAANKAREAAKIKARTEKGICITCRLRPPREGKRYCLECSQKSTQASARRREKLKQLRLCAECGRKRPKRGRTKCADCSRKSSDRRKNQPQPQVSAA
jgi:hypothetical protein